MSNNPIKILLLCESFTGGCKRHILDFLRAADDPDSFQITIAYSDLRERGCWTEIPLRTNIKKVLIRMIRRPAPLLDLIALVQIFLLIRRGGFDIIHLHSSKAGFLGRLASWVARRLGCRARILYSPHGPSFQIGGFWGWLYLAAERRLSPMTDRFVAVSEGEKKVLLARQLGDSNRIVIIANGVDYGSYIQLPKRPHSPQKQYLTVGMIGRLVKQKGARYFVEAAKSISDRHPNIRFLVAGNGPQKWFLQGLTPRSICHIEFTGEFPVKDFLSRTDIVVIPSLWEGLPYVLLEAMAAGRAVVASDIPGLTDTLAETGLTVRPRDPAAITNAVCLLIESPEERERLAQAARLRVEEKFSVERFISEMKALYHREKGLI